MELYISVIHVFIYFYLILDLNLCHVYCFDILRHDTGGLLSDFSLQGTYLVSKLVTLLKQLFHTPPNLTVLFL